MKDSDWDSLKVVDRNFSYFGRGWLQILLKITPFFLRSCVVVICFLFNICIRKCLCPVIPFEQVRRYVESIVNLLCMRVTLIMLGFMNFQCESFAFFRKDTEKIYLKSGFIGIGTHKSILDYLYYSYLLNPVFVRLIIYKKEDKEEIYYSPLSFIEGIRGALDVRGFDPIIVRNEKQYKAVKYRKLAMKTLVSQCFQQQNGPIFILLPGLHPNIHININKNIAIDIYQNEIKFERSLVGFSVKLDQRLNTNEIYKNQFFVLIDLLARFSWLKMKIQVKQYRKWKNRYDRVTYPSFVDKFYQQTEYALKEMDYQYYLLQLDRLFMQKQYKKTE